MAEGAELKEIQNKQNYAVGQATKKLQKAPGIETYLKQINNYHIKIITIVEKTLK